MGCNCGGSLQRAVASSKTRRAAREGRQQAQEQAPRQGGPGSKGYTWDGPRRRTPPAPASE